MTAPSPPVYGDFIYVHNAVGNPYGVAGSTVGVEYTVDIENLIAGGYMTIAPGSVSDPYTVPLGSYGTDPLNPAPGEWVYVYNVVGTPYGNAGTVVGVEYTTHIHRLVEDGSMQLTLPPTSQYENFPLYGDNTFASLGMVKDLMYAYYGGYDGGDGDYSHLIISQRLRDAIVEEMGIAYDPTVQALLDDAEAYNASTLAARDLTREYASISSIAATIATEMAEDVDTYRIASQTAATTATNQATIATNQATTATTQAGIATTKAGEAATSAADALAYRNTASTHATTATTQAGIATTKAGEASTSAANALSYRNTANTAATAAEAARDVALANALTWRGTWSAGTSYIARDAVSYNGSSWRALAPSTGVTPVEGASWTILAAKGDIGTTAWGDLTGTPSTFPPNAHTHPVTDMTATGRTSSNYLRGDNTWATPTNTTYAVPTQAEIEAGTATTARAISAVTLKGAVQKWATGSYTTAITPTGQSLASAANAAAARTAIGAGTSDLTIGTTGSTAKAGDYQPAWTDVTSKPATYPPTIGSTAADAVAGNDPRLTNARTPTAHTHPATDLTATGRTASNYLRGDNTWATPPDTSYPALSSGDALAGSSSTASTIAANVLVPAIRYQVTGSAATAVSALGQAIASAATTAVARGVLMTVEAQNGITAVWIGTQAQYDAIGTKSSTTVYFITA